MAQTTTTCQSLMISSSYPAIFKLNSAATSTIFPFWNFVWGGGGSDSFEVTDFDRDKPLPIELKSTWGRRDFFPIKSIFQMLWSIR